MTTDRKERLAEVVRAFDEYQQHLRALQQKLESGGKDPRSFFPFVERDENLRLTAFRLALADVFGERSSAP